jgi:hypothetical protein
MRIPIQTRMDPHWFGSLDRILLWFRIEIKSWIRIGTNQNGTTTLIGRREKY